MGRNFKTAIFTTLATLFVTLSTPAQAFTNEDLYRRCKPFADNSFQPTANLIDDGICLGYMRAIYDFAGSTCATVRKNSQELGENELSKMIGQFLGIDAEKMSLTAGIQKYVNDMQAKPEFWQSNAASDVLEVYKVLAPCE